MTVPSTPAAAAAAPAAPAAPRSGAGSPPWWAVLPAIVLLAFAVYLPAIWSAQFLNFDDNLYFGPDNPVFRAAAAAAEQDGVLAGLAAVIAPGAIVADVWLPVAHGSLFLDYWWSSAAPFWPHLHSLLLHVAAAVVLWRALLALTASLNADGTAAGTGTANGWLAAAAALGFAVHPALCESVAWVSGRKDVLAGLFVFAALWCGARWLQRPRAGWLVAVAGLTALAMYSKATAVVLPLLLAACCLLRRGPRRRWLLPLVSLCVAAPIALHHQAIAAAAGTMASGSALARLPQVPGAMLHYARTAAWPAGLNVLHPEVQTLERFRAALWPAAIVLALLAAAAAVAWRRPSLRVAAFGVLAFVLALLPFNTAFPASSIAAADRYLYLAVPFLLLAIAAVLGALLRRPWVAVPALALPLLVLGTLRAGAFHDSETLWERSLAVDDDNAVAWLNLEQARYWRTPFDPATEPLLERALQAARYPEHRRLAALRLMGTLRAQGRMQAEAAQAKAAVDAADAIVQKHGGSAAARAVLVDTLLRVAEPLRDGGDPAAAQAALARAAELAPDDPAVLAQQIVLDVAALVDAARRESASGGTPALGDDAPAVRAIQQRLDAALAANGRDPALNLAAAEFLRVRGRNFEAIKFYRRAQDADPTLADAWHGAAQLCVEQGLYPEAERYALAGMRAQLACSVPVDPRLRLALARAMTGLGRLDDAIRQLKDHWIVHRRDLDAARLLSSLLMTKALARLSDADVTHAELQRLVDEALEVNPNERRVDIVRARLCRDRREFAAAVAALDRVRAAFPEYEDAGPMLVDCLRDLGYERMLAGDADGAAAAWRRFLALAGDGVPKDAVQGQLDALWRRAEGDGVAALKRGDTQAAEAAFRRCLQIEPEQHWASWLLVNVLLERQDADAAELDRLSEQAVAWQQQHGLDSSKQVLVRVIVLQRLARDAEAKQLADRYLQAPDPDARAEIVQLLRDHAR